MNRGRIGRTLALAIFSGCVTILNTGCIDKIFQNMIVGFGFSLGALPAQVVADQLFASLFPTDDGA